jgi:hypothetical protein
MSPAGFAPAIPASERPQNQALDRAATGIGKYIKPNNNGIGHEMEMYKLDNGARFAAIRHSI